MTAPYYSDEHVTLYHGDCREITEWLDADVLVTDPPYGIGWVSAWRTPTERFNKINGDETTTARDAMLLSWGDRPALVFGTWRMSRPAGVRQRLVWAKGDDPGLGDLAMPWGYGDEEIYVMGRGWTGARRTNVYRVPKVHHANNPGHPTPKPETLMLDLIARCPDGTVADPFAGSGSTLVAAKQLGRKAIGVELEERYCEIAARRLSQGVLDFGAAS